MREVGAEQMADVARGAAILGTGGGGDPYVGRLMAARAIREHGPVTLVEVDEVPPDALVAPVAMMGAPTVMVEKPPSGAEIGAALDALEGMLDGPISYLACIEAGGVNSTIPFAAAARTGLPLVDADGMGRAFPELQMVLPTLVGVAATPMAMADEKGNTVVLRAADNRWAERISRSVTIDMGCSAMISLYVLRGDGLRDALVPGALSLVERLGRLVREARGRRDPVAAVVEALRGRRLFTGKVVDVRRRTTAGFARGTARLAGTGGDHGHALELEFQNEHLVARRDGRVVASVPDLICVLDDDTGEPITTEGLRYGFRVSVLGAPCDPRWRTPAGLALAGPRYFGYDHDFVPVEDAGGMPDGSAAAERARDRNGGADAEGTAWASS